MACGSQGDGIGMVGVDYAAPNANVGLQDHNRVLETDVIREPRNSPTAAPPGPLRASYQTKR
jgi:hypothetical protein